MLESTSDAAVDAFVLQSLVALREVSTIAASGADVFDCLSSKEPTVRSAAVAALALLDPQDLAPYAEAAVDAIRALHDAALANLAAASWAVQLEADACRDRAGESACDGALKSLRAMGAGNG